MHLCSALSFFIWFSFLYRGSDCAYNDAQTEELTAGQQRQLYNQLESLSQPRRKQLFGDFERQRQEFELSSSKWARLRETPYDNSPSVKQAEVDNISKIIKNGGSPVIRNKRTLKFLVKSLAEILGLRLTLLKYSLLPGVINSVIGPAPASPAPPAKPAPNAPPSKNLPPPPPPPRNPPPPPRKPPPPPPRNPPPPPKAPPAPPAPPTTPAPPPPTIPPNQIDPNTIRYPFRPAPTIPFLNFAPLPPGVTVPYPPLFQWPSQPPAMPTQPPCAAPPPAGPKNPPPPAAPKNPPPPTSRLPLPKPRPPVPPPPPPVKPVLPASPGKTPLKLEYDHPVRIEIFNNVKSYLPVSGSVYSGDPTLTSLEEKDENELYSNPTQAIHDIDDHYTNTEVSQNYHDDGDYGFLTNVPKYFTQTTPQQAADYDHTEKITDYDEDHEHYEETTRHNNFLNHDSFEDYPEQAEENRANVNIKVRHSDRSRKPKRIHKPKKYYDSRRNTQNVLNNSSPSWKVQSFPPFPNQPTTEYPKNHAQVWREPQRVSFKRRKVNAEPTTPKNSFRIVVPDQPFRKRRDIFFDEAFKNFNFSAFDSFKQETAPEPTEAQFLEANGKLIPNLNYRKKLEKDIESYVEKYVEKQISQGEIDVTKPKTTIIELKPKEGPPIKTITTTLSKIVEGKPFLQSVLDYSKGINPVSNIAEFSGVDEQPEKSEVEKAFENQKFDTPFSWNLSSLV